MTFSVIGIRTQDDNGDPPTNAIRVQRWSFGALIAACLLIGSAGNGSRNSPYKLVARMLVGSEVDADLVRACYAGLRDPDLTILLDVSPEVALARKQGHSALEAGHNTSENAFVCYQNTVRQRLADLAGQHGWLVVDAAELDPAQLLCEVTPAVHRVLHGQPVPAGLRR